MSKGWIWVVSAAVEVPQRPN